MFLTRGAFTMVDSAISRPAWRNSLSPRGNGAEVRFISLRKSHVARLQTNSPLSATKLIASFMPSEENMIKGGFVEIAVKKE